MRLSINDMFLSFLRFVEFLHPAASIKSRWTYSRRTCEILYLNVKDAVDQVLLADLPDVASVGLTTDHWMSRAMRSYQAITLHYLDVDFNLKKWTIAIKPSQGRHTGEAIALQTDALISQIPHLDSKASITMVTDGAANMKKAMRESERVGKHLLCMDHILNLAVQNALKVDSVDVIVQKCKRLAKLTHKSSQKCEKIEAACNKVNKPYRKIIQPVATRWNSMYDCMESIHAMKDSLRWLSLHDTEAEFTAAIPTVAQFDQLKDLLMPLSMIKKSSERLSASDQPTIHLVVSHLYQMMGFSTLSTNLKLSAPCIDFCNQFEIELSNRVQDLGRKNIVVSIILVFAWLYLRYYTVTEIFLYFSVCYGELSAPHLQGQTSDDRQQRWRSLGQVLHGKFSELQSSGHSEGYVCYFQPASRTFSDYSAVPEHSGHGFPGQSV
jgi:hypothetical protein